MPGFLQFLCLLFVTVSLSACIEVEKVGDGWNLAKIDPALEGRWIDPQEAGNILIFTREGDHYVFASVEDGKTDVEGLVKTISAGSHTFGLMIKSTDAADGVLVPYKIVDTKLITYTLDNEGDEQDVNVARNADLAVKSAARIKIKELNEQSIESLVYIFENSPRWVEKTTAVREGK
jgi:hypothetical protein